MKLETFRQISQSKKALEERINENDGGTISWMRISMNKTRIKNLLREDLKKFSINVGQIKFILANVVHVAYFVAIDPFSC